MKVTTPNMQVTPTRPRRRRPRRLAVAFVLAGCLTPLAQAQSPSATAVSAATVTAAGDGTPVLWRDPTDVASRDLRYGPGGEEHQPHGPFTFVREDLNGHTPKFVVHDSDGAKWTFKLGPEARAETVASRVVWAVGYAADEDYFLSTVQVQEMPPRVHRGTNLITQNGLMHNVRAKRESGARDKVGEWQWRVNPFSGTRELNGLRVLMAVINNWDLKDINNAIIASRDPTSGYAQRVYEISDLGASFGAAGLARTDHPIGDLDAYRRSRFITRRTQSAVDFDVPRRADWIVLVNLPEFLRRLHLRWIGREIPRQDARWMGRLLSQLSSTQIRDAFGAAGYSPDDIHGFAAVLASRIAQLNNL
jgi:hypothetical protein